MIIDFKDAKLNYDLQKTLKKLRKVYNDISITYYKLPQVIIFIFIKDNYKRELQLSYIELESYDIEQQLKFYLNKFNYEVYEKRENEILKGD